MPACSVSLMLESCSALPSKTMLPLSQKREPVRMFIIVDFPAPFSPRSAWTSPASTDSSAFFRTGTPWKDLQMSFISSSAITAPFLKGGGRPPPHSFLHSRRPERSSPVFL